ncbi:MAG TPA: nucleoside monophosphate kinase [Candidatus Sumerlaeota bacterium]|nr:nucleoside monophosphate kinase [Candidatus Sumerlaeota bacterium]HON49460.1 nucleoside monophosphate kinase [Candidatus Sumerlaeota bacterium]HOR64790.1 nucleoside monophosphate kinase [Candidatus Sumerlaeota bacterium]HPL72943.1 nucleoside monophosphate kinase [Candidatus Sumerlaeota bacterium]
MNIVMIGVQGAGKGTQSKMLSEKLGIPHISTGDIFRDNIKNQTPLGKEARKYIDRGALVPDAVVINMALSRINQPDAQKGYILDGFPRNGVQLAALEFAKPVDRAILLELDDATAIQRLNSRTICDTCGAIYGANRSPKISGVCDECGSALVERKDDKDATAIQKRLNLYHQEIDILVRYYEWKSVLRRILTNGNVDEIFALCLKAIEQ